MKQLLATLFLLFAQWHLWAQGSYMYLEPIKGLPCKVVLNQKEVIQLTKNYFLLPLKGEGEYTIDLVFGSNLHPKQTFVVDVVDGAAYGFKLARTAENKFYLLDLVNTGKIVETNSLVNLALTTEENIIRYFDPQSSAVSGIARDEPRRGGLFRRSKSLPTTQVTDKTSESPATSEKFGVVQVITSAADEPATASHSDNAASRCLAAASDEEVNSFAVKLAQKNDDESKLILMRKKIFTGCLTCRQVVVLTETLNTQYGRFSSVKIMRPLMSDPANISQLEPLFRTESYKSKLREIQ